MTFSSLLLTLLLLPPYFSTGVGPENFRPAWMNKLVETTQEPQEQMGFTSDQESLDSAALKISSERVQDPARDSIEAKRYEAKLKESVPQTPKLPGLSAGSKRVLNHNVVQKTISQPNSQARKQNSAISNPLQVERQDSVASGKQINEVHESVQRPNAPQTKLTSSIKQEKTVIENDRGKETEGLKKTLNSDQEKKTPGIKDVSEIVEKIETDDSDKGQTEDEALSSDLTKLKTRIETSLQYYYLKPVNADVLRPWSIMHGVLGYGQKALVTSQGKKINAVDYLCHNGIGNDRKLFHLKNSKLSVAVGTGFQGHEGQLLAILAQVKTPIDHPIKVDGQDFTVRDLVEYEKLTCRAGTELTFKLIGLSAYLPTEEVWKDERGQGWDISRLLYEEMAQPINGAACGGTHRLMGLSYALAVRRARGEPIDGQWKRAESFTESYQKKSLTLQNPDGGFSTEFFEGVSHSPDPIRQMYSTGHLLEWLSFSMTREQLRSPEITRMVNRLLDLLEAEYRPQQELTGTDVGPKGHALRALRLYELRLFDTCTDVEKLASQDQRPLISATEVPAMQKKVRAILPSMAEPANVLSTSSSPNIRGVEGSSSQPNTRGRGIMRRR